MKKLNINGINYISFTDGNAVLISNTDLKNKFFEFIGLRNGANFVELPMKNDTTYINFIPKKTIVYDDDIAKINNVKFEYFLDLQLPERDKFTLPDNTIFRCFSESDAPKSKENYTYYIMTDGIAKKIPNFKTLEVLLHSLDQTLISVKILSEAQCNDIYKSGEISDQTNQWSDSMKDITTSEALQSMQSTVKSGQALATQNTASANAQIDAVKQQAAASKAQAEQAKAEAEAAKAASEAAIAEANAAQAQAELTIQNNKNNNI